MPKSSLNVLSNIAVQVQLLSLTPVARPDMGASADYAQTGFCILPTEQRLGS
jgi:hypothetical protein